MTRAHGSLVPYASAVSRWVAPPSQSPRTCRAGVYPPPARCAFISASSSCDTPTFAATRKACPPRRVNRRQGLPCTFKIGLAQAGCGRRTGFPCVDLWKSPGIALFEKIVHANAAKTASSLDFNPAFRLFLWCAASRGGVAGAEKTPGRGTNRGRSGRGTLALPPATPIAAARKGKDERHDEPTE